MSKLNLIAQLLMGAALLAGMWLARRGKFRAHAFCQTSVVFLNLIPIFYFMAPVFHKGVQPGLPQKLNDSFYSVATAHAALGTLAEVLGIYIILVAGTKLVPAALHFKKYKPWMRLELAVWWLTILFGLGTYFVWYGGAPSKANDASAGAQPASSAPTVAASPQAAPQVVTVEIGNFAFTPKELTIEAGTTVVWKNNTGRHTVVADDSGFESTVMAAGEEFRRTFEREGRYQYYCSLHGAAGGADMAGTINVTTRRQP
jgi:plastocyanin/uncharacterized membrane protein YozB (DUF420 family)